MASARLPSTKLVAVRRRLDDARRAHHAAGAADILDDDLLTQDLGEPAPDNASEHIGTAAGSERNHHGQRPAWPVLFGGRMNAGEPAEDAGQYRRMSHTHGLPP